MRVNNLFPNHHFPFHCILGAGDLFRLLRQVFRLSNHPKKAMLTPKSFSPGMTVEELDGKVVTPLDEGWVFGVEGVEDWDAAMKVLRMEGEAGD